MNAYKCDRCGGYFDNKNHVTISEVVEDDDKRSSTAFYQLCPSCEKDLLSWLHNENIEELYTVYSDIEQLYSCSKEVMNELVNKKED